MMMMTTGGTAMMMLIIVVEDIQVRGEEFRVLCSLFNLIPIFIDNNYLFIFPRQ